MRSKLKYLLHSVLHQPRFLAVLVAIFLAGMLISVGIIVFYQVRYDNLQQNAQIHENQRVREVADKIETYLISAHQLAASAASLVAPPLHKDKASVEQILTRLLLSAPEQAIYGVGAWFEPHSFDHKIRYFGPYVHRTAEPGAAPVLTYEWTTEEYDFHHQPWYLAGKKANGELVFTEPYFDTDLVYMSAVQSFFNVHKHFSGVVTVDMILPLLYELVKKENLDPREIIYVTTAKGYLFVHPQQTELLQFARQQGKEIHSILELDNSILAAFRGELSDATHIIASNKVLSTGWNVHVEAEKGFLLNEVSELGNFIWLALLTLWLIVLLGSAGLLRISILSFEALQEEERWEAEQRERQAAEAKLQQALEEQMVLEQKVASRTQELSQTLHQLKTSQIQLVQSEKMAMLGQMVAGLAHEINTPLGYVKNNLLMTRDALDQFSNLVSAGQRLEQVIKDKDVTEEQMQTALNEVSTLAQDLIEQQLTDNVCQLAEDSLFGVTQISELVISLRNFARLDQAHVKAVNIHECIDSALKIAHNKMKDRVEIHKYYGQLPTIECSPARINQVILHLLHNATDAISEHGIITLTTTADDRYIHLSIKDNGKGIAAEHLNKIFEPFFTTKGAGEGAGLGLAICSQIIDQHQGYIKVDSQVGIGTTVTVSLPISHDITAL